MKIMKRSTYAGLNNIGNMLTGLFFYKAKGLGFQTSHLCLITNSPTVCCLN